MVLVHIALHHQMKELFSKGNFFATKFLVSKKYDEINPIMLWESRHQLQTSIYKRIYLGRSAWKMDNFVEKLQYNTLTDFKI